MGDIPIPHTRIIFTYKVVNIAELYSSNNLKIFTNSTWRKYHNPQRRALRCHVTTDVPTPSCLLIVETSSMPPIQR